MTRHMSMIKERPQGTLFLVLHIFDYERMEAISI